ncbi:MAG TPA: ROK family protein [Acetobacteraceae bacterium]|nr:ROK family protein [Acetobacteraceae bacterium]
MRHRIGIDLGGTKTEVAVLAPSGDIVWRRRTPTPPAYPDSIRNMAALVLAAESAVCVRGTVGVGIPGVISPASGLVKNANSQALIGHALDRDLEAALGREVRVENDANCFALSEASDGAGQGARCVFGVIMGTGCGGGIVVDGKVLGGRHRIAGEWGHTPLPWPRADEYPLPRCWCGQDGCLELYLAGPGLARSCDAPDAASVLARAETCDARAKAALDRHADRLARGLAVICNIVDPDVIVLGGGLSNMAHLYERLPVLLRRYVFSDVVDTPVVQNRHGDSSGVRGAAWLWPLRE